MFLLKIFFYLKISQKLILINYQIKNFSIYSRFSLHSLTLKEENNLIKNLSQSEKLEYIFIETRTIYDELYGVGRKMKKNEFFSDHYRRFIDPVEIKKNYLKILK